MYQNIAYQRRKNLIHIWDDQRGHYTVPYRKYAYIKSPNGSKVALDGTRVEKTSRWDDDDLDRGNIYESDINIENRTLIDLYMDSDDMSENHRIMFLDIEVAKEGGYSSAREARNTITAISFYDSESEQYVAILLDRDKNVKSTKNNDFELISCQTESDLLTNFYRKYIEIQPTIVTGWNSDFYDIPYLYNRSVQVVGKEIADCLSPIQEVFDTSKSVDERQRYKISGVSCLDYMSLYKNFTLNEESSYALDAIAKKELGRGKVEYDGDLDVLYKTDIKKFIQYNLVDVELIVEMDKKLNFLDLARGICHKGHVPYEDIYFSSRYLDGAALTYLKRLDIIAPNRKRDRAKYGSKENEFEGAYVKEPNPGLYKWVYDLDLTSLYPSIIMTLNISPESKIGKIINWDAKEFVQGVDKKYELFEQGHSVMLNKAEITKYITDNKYSVSANGVLYRTDMRGFLPTILDTWFNERVEFRKLSKKYHNIDEEKYKYFDQRQAVQKVLLNSFYGVLGLPSFRFHDLDNAAAITLTGQQIINYTQDMGNYYYTKLLGEKKDHCIYVDTDSVFFSALPIINKLHPNLDHTNEIKMTEKTLEIASEVQNFINDSYDLYAEKFHNVNEHRFNIKQELVASAGIWVKKKRYAQWIINEEGHQVSKLDVKGLDTVRSSFPVAFRKFMSEILESILRDADREEITSKILSFKDGMKSLDLLDIMSPTGVKKIRQYVIPNAEFGERMLGTPAHVKAALAYNDMLKYYNITDVPPLSNGDKIKWAYLRPNSLGLESLAITGYEDPKELIDLITEYVDYEKIFNKSLKKKLQQFFTALKWGDVPANSNFNKFFKF